MALTIAAVAVSALIILGAVVVSQLRPWKPLVRQRVLVVLLDDRVIEGVLTARRGPLLELRDAAVMQAGQRVQADGMVIIERHRIAWIQVLS